MKKIMSLILILVMVMAFAGCEKKDIEKIPSLETIITMDEGDINSVLPGYTIEQLKEAWGVPNDSCEQTDVWYLNDMRLIVNCNWLGEVVVCGLEEAATDEPRDLIPMVMVNGTLYLDTGKESPIKQRKCGTPDGEITSSVEQTEKPTKDNQSNFGTGYEYQYSAEGTIELYMNEKWWVFAAESEK